MEKFIPYGKLSKKNKKKYDSLKRRTWQISPVTRKPDNPKAYKRNKTHFNSRDYHEPDEVCLVF